MNDPILRWPLHQSRATPSTRVSVELWAHEGMVRCEIDAQSVIEFRRLDADEVSAIHVFAESITEKIEAVIMEQLRHCYPTKK